MNLQQALRLVSGAGYVGQAADDARFAGARSLLLWLTLGLQIAQSRSYLCNLYALGPKVCSTYILRDLELRARA